jgi:two-component system CheB/CheR fusion protein
MVPANDQRLHQLLEQLQARTGLDFHHYKAPTIQRRLLRRMAATDQFTLEEYLRYLQQHPSEYQQLAASFLIKVTEFFRDPELFAALQQRILPELIAQAREHSQELRLWSAGCATGEEAYSLAILVAELLCEEREQWTVYIFATDIDAQAIAFARRGSYPAAALTSVPPDLVRRYFVPHEGGTSEVSKAIRNLVVFGEHDLGNRAPFPRIDLVLCRNVLIYFTPELQRRALQLFAFALRPGGRLVLGPSETTSPLPEYFVLEDGRLKIYRRQGESLVMPGPLFTPKPAGTPAPPRSPVAGLGLPRVSHAPTNRPTPEPAEQLLQELSVGLVVVDHRYDIQAINFAARRLLEIHTAALGEDIIHLAHRLPSERLRSALNRALQGQVAIEQFTMPSLEGPQAERHQLEIQCSPHRTGGVTEPIRQALLLITDLGVLAADR